MVVKKKDSEQQLCNYKLAVIGEAVSQSLSPIFHNQWLRNSGISGRYDTINCPPTELQSTVLRLKKQKYRGWNVTTPHKERICAFLDDLSPEARRLRAVNTVKNRDGRLVGYNTDGAGFLKHVRASAPSFLKNASILVLGAGGAARAIVAALCDAGCAKVFVCNRTMENAQKVREDFGEEAIEILPWSDRSNLLFNVDMLVNATTLGMQGKPSLEIDLSLARNDTIVSDIVYSPQHTALLCAAHARGLRCVDGLGMLYHQAAAAFALWFGVFPQDDDGLLEKLRKTLP